MTTTPSKPQFVQDIENQYSAGIAHAFILSGNISDYVTNGVTLNNYLVSWLSNRTVVFYNRATGFSFPTPSMESDFREAVSDQGQSQPQATNPALAALQASRSGQSQQDEAPLPTSPDAALPLIEKFLLNIGQQKGAVVIEWAETIAPSADIATMAPADRNVYVTLSRWGRESKIELAGNYIFLVTDSFEALADSAKAASNKYSLIEVPYPTTAQRLDYVEWYTGADSEAIDLGDLTPKVIANMTSGLNLMMVEDILLRAQLEGQMTASMIKARKAQIVKSEYSDVLETMEPQGGYELIGGLDYIKEYFAQNVIKPMRAGNSKRVPMGVMMMGPAGTGKSIMAESVAFEAQVNCVKLNIGGSIASKWQGEGERKLAKALRGILNFAPTTVFIDEIDQVMGRGQGNNQQDSRIFQMLLEFMADTSHRGQVVFLAATNRPDLMDAALKRPGRFDDKIAFLVPSTSEREAIFTVMAKKYGLDLGGLSIPSEAIEYTEGYTGAEIEAIARKAAIIAEDFGTDPHEAIGIATTKIKATTQDIEYMTNVALAEINDIDLLPPAYQERALNQEALQAALEITPERRQARR